MRDVNLTQGVLSIPPNPVLMTESVFSSSPAGTGFNFNCSSFENL